MSFVLRSQKNALLFAVPLLGAFGFGSSFLLTKLEKNAPASPAAVQSGTPSKDSSVITGSTHSDTQVHSPNVQSAGDYHVEAQMDNSGHLELYLYGTQPGQLSPIPTIGLDLTMEAKAIIPGEDNAPIALKAKPYPSDPAGFSSRFVGSFARRPDQQAGLSLTLPIEDRVYRVQWRPENLIPGQFASAGDAPMPQAVPDAAAQKLFLTPGGLYTAADIAANGNQTAKQKYGSQMSAHNAHPKPGDRICPITDTVSNPKFAWIVGGKLITSAARRALRSL